MKNGQISLEIGIVIIACLLVGAIATFQYSSNISESNNIISENTNMVQSNLDRSDTILQLNNEFSNSQSNPEYYWVESNDKLWLNTNISKNSQIKYIVEIEDGYLQYNDGNKIFDFFEDFENDLSKWWKCSTASTSYIGFTNSNVYEGNQALNLYQLADNGDTSISSKLTLNLVNKTFESHVYDDLSINGSYAVGMSSIYMVAGSASGTYNYRLDGGSWVTSTLPRTTGWHTMSIDFNGTNNVLYVDNELIGITENPKSTGKIITYAVWVMSGAGIYQDLIVVRDSTIPEIEINTKKIGNTFEIIVNNPTNYDLNNYEIAVNISELNINQNTSLKIGLI